MAKYTTGNHTFVNPYNFVRMNRKKMYKTRDSKYNKDNLLSGVLHCSFTTKTPLAIPDAECKISDTNNAEHYRYPFYRINGVPSVPGSSIRGMLRSLYETVTDSCYVTLSENESITARTFPSSQNQFKEGVLLNEGKNWTLYSAKRYYLYVGNRSEFLVKTDDDGRYIEYKKQKFKMGDQVKIKTHQEVRESRGRTIKKTIVDDIAKDNSSNAYVYVGEEFGKKKYESVFEIQNKVDLPADKVKELLNGLENSVSVYQDSAINKNFKKGVHTGYKNFKYAKRNGAICVWYKEVDGKYYLSMAAIGRKSYNETINTMIGEHRNPCNSRENMCPACKLFGMAKGDGFGSRIRITDAQIQGESSFIGEVCLKELGSPRTGYYPFYTSNGKEYDQPGAVIAGRKYYWHIPKVNEDASIYTSSERTERNVTMELMDIGTKFDFDIYYDKVTPEQLNEIKWSLTLPDNSGQLMHKLGHGKPLGLGTIKITIKADIRREFDGNTYKISSQNVSCKEMPSRIDRDIWEQIKIICNYNTMENIDVCYPYIEISEEVTDDINEMERKGYELKPNTLASHQWFSVFRKESGALPGLTEKSLALCSKMLSQVNTKDNHGDFQAKRIDGMIKFFNKEKNFGFILSENEEDFYFSGKDVNKEDLSKLTTNTKVSFRKQYDKKGKAARDIEILA